MDAGDVLRLVMRDGLILALIGDGLGLASSLVLARWLGSFLYGLSPTDPVALAASTLLWIGVALVASLVPAYQSTRVDPLASLRHEWDLRDETERASQRYGEALESVDCSPDL